MPRTFVYIVIVVVLWVSVIPVAHSASVKPIITEYSVPGNPFRMAVEAPGQAWFTLPTENAIGKLKVAPSGAYEVFTYQLPTADSEPYDIAYAAGAVWVTERIGNKIARFDPLVNQWMEYPVLTAASEPTGVVVLDGQPVQVWFAERAGNKLGLYAISDTLTGTLTEFPLPTEPQYTNAAMEDIAAASSAAVWFTLPGVGLIGRFNLSVWPSSLAFDFLNPRNYPWLYPGITLRPWQIKLDGRDLPWFTEPGTNQLMRYNPATIATFEHYPVPSADAELDGLHITQVNFVPEEIVAWYTARVGDRIGRLHKIGFGASASGVSRLGFAPTDIVEDADGCAWSAANGASRIVRWCPPYFWYTYLPLISKR